MPKVIYGVIEENGKKVRRPIVLEDKKCIVCGTIFTPARQDTKCCSQKCFSHASYERNKESCNKRNARWYEEHREEQSKKKKERYWANPEKYREYTKAYWGKHREEKHIKDEQHKDKTRHGGKRAELIRQNGYVCSVCGKTDKHIQAHHVTKNKEDHDKQQLLCATCHAELHNEDRTEALREWVRNKKK